MKKELLESCAAMYRTPAYIFDTDCFRQTIRNLRDSFGKDVGLCYAMKANPFLADRAEKEADRIEICSMGEFQICREKRIEPKKMLISGVMKSPEDLAEILGYCGEDSLYTVESMRQADYLESWSRQREKKIRILLRLSSGNQFGMDEDTLIHLLQKIQNHPYLKIQGIHYFSGTQKQIAKTVGELRKLDDLLKRLEKEYGIQLEELEFGPGLAVAYFDGQKDCIREEIRELSRAIGELRWKGKVTLEMGRAMAASCGTYLTTVKDTKQNGGRNYCIVDGGIHQIHYDGQIRGMYPPSLQVLGEMNEHRQAEDGEDPAKEWCVCGALCTVNDILVQKIKLRNLKEGSILAFEKTGAYAMTEGMGLFLSHALPRIIFYSKKEGYTLARDSQPTYIWNMERRL